MFSARARKTAPEAGALPINFGIQAQWSQDMGTLTLPPERGCVDDQPQPLRKIGLLEYA
jgi:hypothetical protein